MLLTGGEIVGSYPNKSNYNSQLQTVNAQLSRTDLRVCACSFFNVSNVWICGVKSSRVLIRSEDQLWPVTRCGHECGCFRTSCEQCRVFGSLLLKQFWCGISDLYYW